MDNRIKVGVRARPLSSKESQEINVLSFNNGEIFVKDNKKTHFNFDWAFDANSNQRQIYNDMCFPLIERVFEGYNATFFACKNSP